LSVNVRVKQIEAVSGSVAEIFYWPQLIKC